jgi:hypothetical protein
VGLVLCLLENLRIIVLVLFCAHLGNPLALPESGVSGLACMARACRFSAGNFWPKVV